MTAPLELSHLRELNLPRSGNKWDRSTRPRRMPSLRQIEKHWRLEHGFCARCGQQAPCERAHIIDRWSGGLDGVQNLIPLCSPCHRRQPSFKSGQEEQALAWLRLTPLSSDGDPS